MTALRKPYEIVSNVNQRRILVINDVVDVEKEEDLQFEDFDAIFINTIDSVLDSVMHAIRMASPLQSEKCRFKPCFVTRRLKSWIGYTTDILVDGYGSNPQDALVAQTIEEIYANMMRCNFFLGTDPVVTHAEEVYRLCRYAISRGQYTFSSQPTPGLNSGYMALYFNTLWNQEHERLQFKEREYFHQQLLEMGYIRKKRFIDKIHLCPNCNRSHLLFFETCPKCGSSDIKQEDVIHHFRCAHVAPESAYEWDGELKCPKCKHKLLHIGVDYDKPSAVNTCNQCGESFMYSNMRVQCAVCRRPTTPDKLIPLDVEEYEFTPDGIRAFANNDVVMTISQVGFFGHSSMRDFEDYLRQAMRNTEELEKEFIVVMRYHVYDPNLLAPKFGETVPRLVRRLRRLYNYKSALHGNDYYFLCRVKPGEVSTKEAEMDFEIRSEFDDYVTRCPDFRYEWVCSHILHPSEDVETFIKRIAV